MGDDPGSVGHARLSEKDGHDPLAGDALFQPHPSRPRSRWLLLTGIALAYFVFGQFSLSFSFTDLTYDSNSVLVFMAEGVGLAAAVLWGPRIWPGVFVGQGALALVHGLGWPVALGIAAINSAEAALGGVLFRRLRIDPSLQRMRDISLLLVLIVGVMQPISATGGTLLFWWDGRIGLAQFEKTWLSWWLGNSIGQMMVAPMLLAVAALDMGRRIRGIHLFETCLLGLVSSGLMLLGPHLSHMSMGLVLAEGMMVVVAARHGLAGATFTAAIQAVFLVQMTRAGLGPFVGQTAGPELNLFLLRLMFIGQFIAILFAERRQDERQTRLSHDQLSQAQQIANLGSWSMDMVRQRLTWSDELYRILELEPDESGPSAERFMLRVHPEDRERITSGFRDALSRRIPYECSHRLLFPDGRLKYVRARGHIRYAQNGRPLVFLGTMLDMTQMHDAQQRLHLYAHLFEQSGEAIVVTSPENDIVAVNPAFTRLTGYTPEEVMGRNPRFLAAGRTPPETYVALWQSLNERGHWCGELWDHHKDGSVHPMLATMSVIRDPAGKLTNYTASFVDISERKAEEMRIERLAHHDTLTGLHNRFSLHLRLEQALLAARREEGRLAVLFFDMDRFKRVNDELGHHVGDLLLTEIASRLSGSARVSDIIARLGGDEFVMVLTGLGEQAQDLVEQIVSKVSERLAQPYLLDGHTVHSSSSIGIALFPEHGEDIEQLTRHADLAMYHAKEGGRGIYCFYDASMNPGHSERQALEADLQHALDEQGFELHYQPQIRSDGDDRCLYRLEALARWRHSERGWVPPAQFLPIIENMGLAVSFGSWVIDESCRQIARWRAEHAGVVRVAVNLSASQLRSPILVQQTQTSLLRHGIEPGGLEFEIDESVVIHGADEVVSQLAALHELGVQIAVANFGSLLSSLVYLRRLPVDTLKLSREVIAAIDRPGDGNTSVIVDATLTLAHDMKLRVVAEGVETEAQRKFLISHRCDLLQGYLLSKPLTEAEVVQFFNGGGI